LNIPSKPSPSDRQSTIQTLIQLKYTRNIVTQHCSNIARNVGPLAPPIFDTWAQSVDHQFDLDYLVEIDKITKRAFDSGSYPELEMDLQDILIGMDNI
jgi:hypothetical protein